MNELKIKVYRDDTIEGFACYCAKDPNDEKIILLNVDLTLAAIVFEKLSSIEAKEIMITNIMHEVGHALEEHFEKEFDEGLIERAVESYRFKYEQKDEPSINNAEVHMCFNVGGEDDDLRESARRV